ncbi:DUF748 domain-containing protein [Deefgea salmonis]|uniref:DUF748 domain-containing protein n=1 Tax=Deefgea salmonis TaxID=2875502 RepID=A0ABS8BIJ2_9NEIS|nr:DUF748 domain-containing protein [Deefgea salmonis]MCB5195538.1 DUF748 domain-containing protein [Deefgea salmonis]
MPKSFFQYSRWLRLPIYLLASILLLGALGHWAMPPLLRPWLENHASQILHRQVKIGELTINPYSLQFNLADVAIRDQYGPFVSFKSLQINAEWRSIWRMAPVIRDITLEAPKVSLIRLSADRYNFSDLIPKKSKTTKTDEPLPRFSLNNIRIIDGDLRLDDRVVGVNQTLDQLNFSLPFLSTLPQRINEYIQPHLSARFNGHPFELMGESKPFEDSLDTVLKIKIKQQDLTPFLAYIPLPQGILVPKASMSADVEMVFRQQKDRADLLFNGQLQLNPTVLTQNGQDFIALDQLSVELKNLKPLAEQYRFGVIDVRGLDVRLSRNPAGLLNWQNLMHQETADAKSVPEQDKKKSPLFEVAELNISDSQLHWHDQAVSPAVSTALESIHLNIKNYSNQNPASFPVQLSAKTPQAASLAAELAVQASPLQLSGKINASQIQIADYAGYYQSQFPAQLAATVGFATELQLHAEPMQYALKNLQLDIERFTLTAAKAKKPALSIEQLQLTEASIDSASKAIQVGNLLSKNGNLNIEQQKDGEINLAQLFAQSKDKKPAPAKQHPEWSFLLQSGQWQDWKVEYNDQRITNSKPLIWKNIALNLNNVDSRPNSRATMSLQGQGGRSAKIKVAGSWVPQPFSANLDLDLANFDAAYGQPYFNQYVNISLARGFLNAKGNLRLALEPKLSASYTGNLSANNVYALDKITGSDFLKWKSFYIGGIKAQLSPLNIDINEIALSDFYSRLILSADGRLNLQDVMVKDAGQVSVTTERPTERSSATASAPVEAEKTLAESSGLGVPIKINKVTLKNGQIQYTDLFIKPNFSANLTEMGGVIGGLSSNENDRATLNLRGSMDYVAPVEIQGSLNPLSKTLFIDLKGGVKGYELTNASAFAIKYAGYGIEKGKMSMDVSYLIENQKLTASNKIFLDQLTLGPAVESATATKLPVKFVLSLLTNRKGQINLNLPIQGSLNDPQFSLGSIIWQALVNVLEKVVTSPFDALSDAFSDGPRLSHIDFASGSAQLNDQAQVVIGNLSQALIDRPSLNLDIVGWASLESDTAGLRLQDLNKKMLKIKAAQLGEKSESIDSDTDLVISAAERDALLTQVYKNEKFDKPTNVLGLNKSLPPAEMEKLILAHTLISNEQLQALAMRRAQQVKTALQAAGVDNARLFIAQAKINATQSDLAADQGSLSRVQFKLK